MNKYTQALISCIDELIANQATHDGDGYSLAFDCLDQEDINKMIRLQLEIDGRDLYDIYTSQSSTRVEDNLIQLLTNDNKDSRDDLIDAILKTATENYTRRLQDLINERCAEREASSYRDAGRYRTLNRTTGEIQWRSL